MFLKIIRLISVCAIALYLYEIGCNERVNAQQFDGFHYLVTYTKLEKHRNDSIVHFQLFSAVARFALLAPLLPLAALLAVPKLVYTRAYALVSLLRPVLIHHADFTRWYLKLKEAEGFKRVQQNSPGFDGVFCILSLVGLLLILLRTVTHRSAVLDLTSRETCGQTHRQAQEAAE